MFAAQQGDVDYRTHSAARPARSRTTSSPDKADAVDHRQRDGQHPQIGEAPARQWRQPERRGVDRLLSAGAASCAIRTMELTLRRKTRSSTSSSRCWRTARTRTIASQESEGERPSTTFRSTAPRRCCWLPKSTTPTCVKALLDAGADLKITTEQGTTALIMASGAGTDIQRMRNPEERSMAIDTVKLLVERGARRERRRAVWLDGAACGDLSGPDRRDRIPGQQGRRRQSDGRLRTDPAQHFAGRAHSGYRGPPPPDPAPVSSRRSPSFCSSWAPRRSTSPASWLSSSATGDLELGRDGTQE